MPLPIAIVEAPFARPLEAVSPSARFAARAQSIWTRIDPRHIQIAILSSLLLFGMASGVINHGLGHIAAAGGGAFAAQLVGCALIASRPRILSPLITTLSLCLLLRTDAPWAMALAGAIATGSKFALRVNGKHLFNPANAGVVIMLLLAATALPGAAWTTPGQWGTGFWFAALLAGAGFLVTTRAARADAAIVFLLTFAGLSVARALYLGDPLEIPLHRLQSGALIIFAFFMITDPMTTPDGRRARAAFAASVAAISYVLTYHLFEPDAVFYALAFACAVRPLMEAFDGAPAYVWPRDARAKRRKEPLR